jgi:hypothetical protein
MTTLLRIIYLACAVCIAWFGVRYAGEAMADRNNAAAYWCIAATGLVVACLIDWAIERKRA